HPSRRVKCPICRACSKSMPLLLPGPERPADGPTERRLGALAGTADRSSLAELPPGVHAQPSPTMRPMAEDPSRDRDGTAVRDRAPDTSARRRTVRMRVLTTMLAFMAVGLALTGVLTFVAQFRALDHR